MKEKRHISIESDVLQIAEFIEQLPPEYKQFEEILLKIRLDNVKLQAENIKLKRRISLLTNELQVIAKISSEALKE